MGSILITGGAGFIGTNFVQQWLKQEDSDVVVFDKLTYAGNYSSLKPLTENEKTAKRFFFVHADICDALAVAETLRKYDVEKIVHFAAESHVDRSIDGPAVFVRTNVLGTFTLLEECRKYYGELSVERQKFFRFLHVSTDEVYGSLGDTGKFCEETPYDPRSPYSASKASSDFFVNAYFHTYGLPVVTTNCSNNYGPFQFPEKLIPLMILNCLEGKPLPVYGDGLNVRDWLYVEDHCTAIRTVLKNGLCGESYNLGGNCETTNIHIVKTICRLVDKLASEYGISLPKFPCESLITYVKDRPGHDRRYAMDISKVESQLRWSPSMTFEEGMEKTVRWYLENQQWCAEITQGRYQRQRLGNL
ncbi:MAG: dTDP-glucose 4,6-dehydratase [Planctomycetaceae bacterium]|nr:dTDP-glucose 4,6-dehydratase [Planctomycetaceae bacterium]